MKSEKLLVKFLIEFEYLQASFWNKLFKNKAIYIMVQFNKVYVKN